MSFFGMVLGLVFLGLEGGGETKTRQFSRESRN
jgi:hypothetical protein